MPTKRPAGKSTTPHAMECKRSKLDHPGDTLLDQPESPTSPSTTEQQNAKHELDVPDCHTHTDQYHSCTDLLLPSSSLSKQVNVAYLPGSSPAAFDTTLVPVSPSSSVVMSTNRPADNSTTPHAMERKQSKPDHPGDTSLGQPESPTPPSTAGQQNAKHELDAPDWHTHTDAWAFLKSMNPKYPNQYLTRQTSDGKSSAAYLFGRSPDCDFIFEQSEISTKHCAIYMERECNADQETGLSIYLKDLSSNGTFVNGVFVGHTDRALLRTGDRIQLYRQDCFDDEDLRHSFYRILLPPQFEVTKFHSEYIVGKQLGEGSFAAVYKATSRHETPEGSRPRFVAVKSFKKSRFSPNPSLLPSMIQEIGILMSLEAHPCVIKIERVFNEPRCIYLVLEYVSGGDLFDLVTENGQLCESDTRFIFFQLFAGIKFLHEHQIAHCDLKPENDVHTMLIKITDFGLAKTFSTKNPALHNQCGTPAYVAPEVLDPGQPYTKICDLWSLGVMLFVCLGGVLPFGEEVTLSGMKERIRNGIYSYDNKCWSSVSHEAKDLIDRLLTVDPIKRIGVEDARAHDWFQNGLEDLRLRVQELDDGAKELIEYYGKMPFLPLTPPTDPSSLNVVYLLVLFLHKNILETISMT